MTLELFQELLDQGADINGRQGKQQLTPLHVAAKHGNFDMVSCLIAAGAQVNVRDRFDRTPLMMAARHQAHIHVNICRLLLAAGAEHSTGDAYGRSALFYAAQQKDFALVELLAEAGADGGMAVAAALDMASLCTSLTERNMQTRMTRDSLPGWTTVRQDLADSENSQRQRSMSLRTWNSIDNVGFAAAPLKAQDPNFGSRDVVSFS